MPEMPEAKVEKKPEKKSVSVGSVLSKESKPKMESKSGGKKKKMKHTHIEHHDDGSHTVRHTPMGGGDEISYAAPDLDAVHDGLEEHTGEPNDGEGVPAAEGQEPQQPQQAMPSPATPAAV